MTLLPAITFTSIAIALISTVVVHFHFQTEDGAAKFASQHTNKYDEDLIQLAKIASISSLPEHNTDIQRAAEWLSTRLKDAELEVIPDYSLNSPNHGTALGNCPAHKLDRFLAGRPNFADQGTASCLWPMAACNRSPHSPDLWPLWYVSLIFWHLFALPPCPARHF
jgi:hypothetical protein